MTFAEYEEKALRTRHHTAHLGLYYPALKLAGEAGEVAEKIGKMYRDDAGILTAERRLALLDELGDPLWYITEIAHRLGFSLEDVARRNNEKLADREERGVIKGDGDKR